MGLLENTCRCNKGFNDRFDGIVSAGGNKISERGRHIYYQQLIEY